MHTHVVVQADPALGLTLRHHPRQQHGHRPLRAAQPEAVHDGLVDGEPAGDHTRCVTVTRRIGGDALVERGRHPKLEAMV